MEQDKEKPAGGEPRLSTRDASHPQSPEEEELDAKLAELAELEDELASTELELLDLKLRLAQFEERYLSRVGRRLLILEELERRIRALEAKARGEASPEETASARKSLEELLEELREEEFVAHKEEEAPTHEPSGTLKELYRKAVKLLHSDLESDPRLKAKREELMKRLNSAYEKGDEEEIRRILAEWESEPEAVKGEGVAFELVRVIRKIASTKRKIAVLKNEIEELKGTYLYQLMLEYEKALAEGRNLLAEIAQELDKKIDNAKVYLRKLGGKI